MEALIDIVNRMASPRIVLMGDFMLDRYIYGDAERLSPEAPIAVLNEVRRQTQTGGAGNVATAILALGGQVSCIGAVGSDREGEELIRLLTTAGADTSRLLRLNARPTTVKSRFVGLAQHRRAQQLLRVDTENSQPLGENAMATLKAAVRGELHSTKVLAIEDYNKGLFNNTDTPEIIAHARKVGCKVLVDPYCLDDYRRYRGATLLTPNRYEAECASGIKITDDESLARAARQILMVTEAEAVMITLDKEGIYLHQADGTSQHFATRPRQVYDVSGAGDEVLAMMAMAIAEGTSLAEAIALANVAGGLEVERFGTVPITREEIADELRHMVGLRAGKVVERNRLGEELSKRKANGERVVFTNGCFDLLHVGHLRYLQQARELGNCLVVAINSDESVRRLKGEPRPVIPQDERAEVLGALECVDYVTIFDEDTPENLLNQLKPDYLVKGGTTDVIVGQDIVEGYGGKVASLQRVDGLSTTEIITRIVETQNGLKE